MCGFVGVINKNSVPADDLTQAARSILTRGPDMQGVKSGLNWKVAFNRLSIHDLSEHGMQPFHYEGVTVYLNGEIFNYIELLDEHKNEFLPKSGSDVEIIPFLYKKYGLDFLNRLNGMFAIVIFDETRQVSYLIRDRFSEKPLYYHFVQNRLYFASEVKAIKQLLTLEVDKINLKMNFLCWFLPQPQTLYENTFNVNPGSYIEYKDGNIDEKRWYNPLIKVCHDTEKEIADTFIALLKSSIELRLRSDVPVGIFLSGGLDSTSIAKFAHELNNKDFFAFGAEITGKDKIEKNNTDVEIPLKLSEELNIHYISSQLNYDYFNNNIVKIVKHYDELFLNSGILVFYELSRLAKENNTSVILTGVAGDELFGGYPWQSGVVRKIDALFRLTYNKLPYSELIYKALIKIHKKTASAYKALADYKVWHAETLSIFRIDFTKTSKEVEKRIRHFANKYFQHSRQAMNNDVYNVMSFANTFTVLGAQNFTADISAMRYSVENRSPLLDYRLYEYMMSIPDKIKIKYGQKGLMRHILKEYLPEYVTQAKKSGPTMPLNTWFYEKEKLPAIRSFILRYSNLIEEYLSAEISQRIENDDDWLFSEKNSLRLFAMLNFIIWARFNILKDIDDENVTFEQLIQRF